MSDTEQTKADPNARVCERGLLGTVLHCPGIADAVIAEVGDADFYDPRNLLVFAAVKACAKAKLAPDPITVLHWLRTNGRIESSGGGAYLAHLMDHVWAPSYWPQYARLMKESTLRRAADSGAQTVSSVARDEGTATSEVVAATATLARVVEQAAWVPSLKTQSEAIAEAFARHMPNEHGLTTGLRTLDKRIGGLLPGNVIVIAARPGMGKSALGIQMAVAAAKTGTPVVFVTLEMDAGELADRSVCAEARANAGKWRKNDVTDSEMTAIHGHASLIAQLPIVYLDQGTLTVDEMRVRVGRVKAERGCGLVVVDYLQLLKPSRGLSKGGSREQEVADISRSLKSMAKDFGLPLVALAQLNRGVESRGDKRPQMSDLRESGAIEQDADLVLLLFREGAYDNTKPHDVAELIVSKNRHGPTGKLGLKWDGQSMRFDDVPYEDARGYE